MPRALGWGLSALLVAVIVTSGCIAPLSAPAENEFPGQWSEEPDRFIVRRGDQCQEHPWINETSFPPAADLWRVDGKRTRELGDFLTSQGIGHGDHGVVKTGAPVYAACVAADDWTYWYEPSTDGAPPPDWKAHSGGWWVLRATYCDVPGWPADRQYNGTGVEPSEEDAHRVAGWLGRQGAGVEEVRASLLGETVEGACGEPAPMVYWVRLETGSMAGPWWPVDTSPAA